ncbi:MAG TPA: NAD-dependent epimerase/dehydratase family protein [Dermatophilaceae bacterium]|nr:NAD-dependent epimerase/dehydratase family protein [Dermatophilaceae bacterium]
MSSSPAPVLVTGGSGFLGSHQVARLLADGHQVRATVRSLRREGEVRALVARGIPLYAGGSAGDGDLSAHLARLELVEADLTADAGWADAVEGCGQVLHLASPLPVGLPEHEDDLVVPARDGALRVLRAARAAGIPRVVLTSSFAAIGYGPPDYDVADEQRWTDPTAPGITAYVKSKTIAERAAWAFVQGDGAGLELVTVNPVAIFGPALEPASSASLEIVKRLIDGSVPGVAPLTFGVVDVRDVVDLHVRAMTDPAAAGLRLLATSGELSMWEMGQLLRDRLGARVRVPSRRVPGAVVRALALVDRSLRQVVPELGQVRRGSSALAIERLGWSPRPAADAVVATAESLIDLGVVPDRSR